MRWVRLLAAAGVTAVAATGCATAPAGSEGGGGPRTALTIATSFAVSDLDPIESGYWAPEFGYGALLLKPVKGGRLEPWLLAELPRQTAPTTWTLRLRPNLTFQNGHRLDAAAAAAAMTFSLAENASVKPLLPGAKVTASGPDTVTLTTATPTSYVPSLLAHESMFPIVDTATYLPLRKRPAELVAARIWAGPYTVTSLTPEAMTLAPTPGYTVSAPKLQKLTVRFVADAQARILAVQHGEADLALYPPTSAARELEGRSDAVYLSQPAGTAAEGFQLTLNPRTGPLSELPVRRALRDGIDYAQLATQVMNGRYDTAVGFYPAFLPYARRNQNHDPDAAKAALEAAGWRAGADGVRSRAGRRLAVTLLTYPQQPDARTIAVAVQAQLKRVGFDIAIRQVDDINAALKLPTGWDAAVLGNGTLDWTQTDPVTPVIASFTPGGDSNYGGVSDPELTGLVRQLAATTDAATRDRLLGRVQEIVVTERVYGLSLALKRVPAVAAPSLRDYTVPPVALLWVDAF
ncbi:ABC transporter substrate-binding protein [Pilimelia terevasa]|uniref:ABC transporter substrate-binding protein n=1 Tax=Pilimelia terevasa TaxID=53372 RepID=A0A8J3BRV6_9ACTN|nr:ABC transporter substrate-binding protein [Pilimelia terevasa]